MTREDFAEYRPRITPGHVIKLKNGLQLCVPRPPSSGAALGFFFQLMEGIIAFCYKFSFDFEFFSLNFELELNLTLGFNLN